MVSIIFKVSFFPDLFPSTELRFVMSRPRWDFNLCWMLILCGQLTAGAFTLSFKISNKSATQHFIFSIVLTFVELRYDNEVR